MLLINEIQPEIDAAREKIKSSQERIVKLEAQQKDLQALVRLKNYLTASENIAQTMSDQELGALARRFSMSEIRNLISDAAGVGISFDLKFVSRSFAGVLVALKRLADETQDASAKKDKGVQNETE